MTAQTSDQPFVFVNAFEIPADQIDAFLDGWRDRAEFMRRQPGFRDYRMLRALLPDSRFQLINVARWDSPDAFHAATAAPAFQRQLAKLTGSGDFDVVATPGLYRVALQAEAWP